jgi:hypothetical protein
LTLDLWGNSRFSGQYNPVSGCATVDSARFRDARCGFGDASFAGGGSEDREERWEEFDLDARDGFEAEKPVLDLGDELEASSAPGA